MVRLADAASVHLAARAAPVPLLLARLARRIELLAMPMATSAVRARVLTIMAAAHVPTRVLTLHRAAVRLAHSAAVRLVAAPMVAAVPAVDRLAVVTPAVAVVAVALAAGETNGQLIIDI